MQGEHQSQAPSLAFSGIPPLRYNVWLSRHLCEAELLKWRGGRWEFGRAQLDNAKELESHFSFGIQTAQDKAYCSCP